MQKERVNIHDAVTAKIIAQIEANPDAPVMPWHRPAGRALHIPKNATTTNAYRGINIIMLWMSAEMAGYGTRLWASFKQWQSVGAQVRKGERATSIVFYKQLDVEPKGDDDDGKRRVARTSFVFNAAQVDGFDVPSDAVPNLGPIERTARFDAFVRGTGAVIKHGGNRAFYSLATDEITMPDEGAFVGTATMDRHVGYMSVLGHELGHFAGASHRLDRQLKSRFGTHEHAAEEIIAEMTSAFICAELGISTEPRADHAQYISHYHALLRSDSRAIFSAAAAASRATAYLFGLGETAAAAGAAGSDGDDAPQSEAA